VRGGRDHELKSFKLPATPIVSKLSWQAVGVKAMLRRFALPPVMEVKFVM